MHEISKQEKKVLLLLTIVCGFAVPVCVLLLDLYVRKASGLGWLGWLTVVTGGVGAAAVALAARRYGYKSCIPFVLPSTAAVLVTMAVIIAAGLRTTTLGGASEIVIYLVAAAAPFLYLAVDRALAGAVRLDGLYVVLTVLVNALCDILLGWLGFMLSGRRFGSGGPLSYFAAAFSSSWCLRTALALAVVCGSYALLRHLLPPAPADMPAPVTEPAPADTKEE